uniref:Transposase n=1 Tax=Leptobrachium leishanense TaxID=445787 RepID=A0A8C5PC04_9ANUR
MSARRPTGQKKRAAASVTHPHTPALTGSSPMHHYLRGSQAVSSQGRKTKMAAAGDRMVESEDDLQDSRTSSLSDIPTAEVRETLRHLPTKRDLESLFSRFEAKFDAKFAELGADVRQLGGRVQDLEEDRDASMAHLDRLQAQINEQSRYVTDLRRSVDDLDNRGRRNNVRIRGVPESEDAEDIPLTLRTLFNALLERPPDTPILLDRAHRALRPRGAPSAPPRDIICRIHHFPLKEEIMQAARKKRSITHDGHAVEVYQDLSRFTLQARRHLKPITDVLRDRDIRYRWGYPFALTVRRDNQLMSIMEPGDVPEFIRALELPQVEIANWHGGDLLDFPPPKPQRQKWQAVRKQKHRHPPGTRQQIQDSTRPLARRGRTPEKFSPSLWFPTPPSTVLATTTGRSITTPTFRGRRPKALGSIHMSLYLLFSCFFGFLL